MRSRPGRPPTMPTGDIATITMRIPADVKVYLIEAAEAVNMTITEYVVAMVRRDQAG